MTEPVPDDFRDRMQAPWDAENFGAVARNLGSSIADAFAHAVQAPLGATILDIACGQRHDPAGSAYFPMMGLDFTPKLLAQARERAAADGLDIRQSLVDGHSFPGHRHFQGFESIDHQGAARRAARVLLDADGGASTLQSVEIELPEPGQHRPFCKLSAVRSPVRDNATAPM